MQKKVLVVDDSALMRRVFCDIINKDYRFSVFGEAANGIDALQIIRENEIDVVVLDVNMPRMNGIELLKALQKEGICPRVMMASLYTREGAKVTMDALECGAMDFIHIPADASVVRTSQFAEEFLSVLDTVSKGTPRQLKKSKPIIPMIPNIPVKEHTDKINKVVAIATSTGGPQALKNLLQMLPKNINAPIVVVQHMPPGFTKTLAERLDSGCEICVHEVEHGEVLQKGVAYIAQGGKHMKVRPKSGGYILELSDEPPRENVKPCANYMFESFCGLGFDEVICVVMTGMGCDGTEGIRHLLETNRVSVLVQSPDTCVVYGMPGNIVKAGMECQILDLDEIAETIMKNVGVQ